MSFSTGFRFGGYEHRWERRTNYAIFFGFIITGATYYVKTFSGETGLISICMIGFCHLCARVSHKGEQHYLRKFRPWRRSKT